MAWLGRLMPCCSYQTLQGYVQVCQPWLLSLCMFGVGAALSLYMRMIW